MQSLCFEQLSQENCILNFFIIIYKEQHALIYISKKLIYFIDLDIFLQKRVFQLFIV